MHCHVATLLHTQAPLESDIDYWQEICVTLVRLLDYQINLWLTS